MTLPAQDIVELVESIRWSKFGDAKWPRRVLTGPEEFERIASTIESLTADNEALRKEVVEARERWEHFQKLASDHKDELVVEIKATSARADALAQEVEKLQKIIEQKGRDDE
jgi:hypothetical protein